MRCNVDACTAAYRSFTPSDCTYQPTGGPRRLCTKIDTADELRRFRVRDAWNRRANAGVSLERLSSRGPSNAVSRLPYRPHGFGQHRAARNPLAHHAGPATQAGRAGVRDAAASQSRGSERGARARFIREKWSLCSRRRPRTMSNTMSVQRLRATRRRRPKRCRSRSPKPQASQHALTIQASSKAPQCRTRRTHKPPRHRQKRMSLTRRPHRTIAATSRPARAPINRSALRTALTSRSTVRAACAARHPNNVPTASKETSRNVDPGAGVRIHVKRIEEPGGGSMTRTTTTRTMRSFSAEAAAGRR